MRITSPNNASTVSGTVAVQIVASDSEDGSGTLRVEISADDGETWRRAFHVFGSLYMYIWETPVGVDNAVSTLVARATDSSANATKSKRVAVVVDNVSTKSHASIAN